MLTYNDAVIRALDEGYCPAGEREVPYRGGVTRTWTGYRYSDGRTIKIHSEDGKLLTSVTH